MNRRANLPPLVPAAPPRPRRVRVWDWFVRYFHWSTVYLVTLCYFTGDVWDDLHEAAGYILAGGLAARVIWGFVGPQHARFADFIYAPATTLAFLRDSLRLRARRYLGHNPAGGAMVVALIVTLATICTSGVMMGMDAFWGEQWVEDLHVGAVNLCLLLVALHLAGVLLASLEHRENLVWSMVTGWKRAQSPPANVQGPTTGAAATPPPPPRVVPMHPTRRGP